MALKDRIETAITNTPPERRGYSLNHLGTSLGDLLTDLAPFIEAEIERLTAELAARAPARAFPRVTLATVAPGSLVEIASGDIGVVTSAATDRRLRSVLWITTGHVGTMPATSTVSLRATPAELDALTSADASRPGLTEEQAQTARFEPVIAAWLAYFDAMDRQNASGTAADAQIVRELRAKANGMDRIVADVVYHVALARHRASRGETGPAAVDPPTPDRPAGLTRAMHDAQRRPSVPPRIEYEHGPDGETYRVEDDWQPCACGAAVSRGEAHPTGPGHDVDWSAVDRQRATPHAGAPASLAEVVAASAREPHADVVLHALHVSGGAAAVEAVEHDCGDATCPRRGRVIESPPCKRAAAMKLTPREP